MRRWIGRRGSRTWIRSIINNNNSDDSYNYKPTTRPHTINTQTTTTTQRQHQHQHAAVTGAAAGASSSTATVTDVLSWGGGAFGGLGCGSYHDHPQPVVIPTLSCSTSSSSSSSVSSPVIHVSCGWTGNIAITAAGAFYYWGYKPFTRSLSLTAKLRRSVPKLLTWIQEWKLGRLTFSNAIITPKAHTGWGNNTGITTSTITNNNPMIAVSSSCGGDYQAVLDAAGGVWTWGSNFFGQLGHPSDLSYALIRQPTRLQSLIDHNITIKQVTCGFSHLVLLTSTGVVYVCGKHDHGALGMKIHTEGKRVFHPQVVPTTVPLAQQAHTRISLNTNSWQYKETVFSTSPNVKYIGPIIRTAAGMKHTLLLAQNGRVYATGHNQFGQCGFAALDMATTTSPTPTPTGAAIAADHATAATFMSLSAFAPIAALRHEHIIDVAAGQHHSVFLTQDGRVFACGLNAQGQCGRERQQSVVRARVTGLHRLTTKKPEFTITPQPITESMKLATQQDFLCVTEPELVRLPSGFGPVVKISAGFYDTAVINARGQVMMFGGEMEQRGFSTPHTVLSQYGPVEQIAFGLTHALIVTRQQQQQMTGSGQQQPSSMHGSVENSSARPAWY